MSRVTLRLTFSSECALTTESNLVFVPLTYFCDMMAFASVCERNCEKKNNPHDHLTHPTRRLSSRITCVATCEAKKKKRKTKACGQLTSCCWQSYDNLGEDKSAKHAEVENPATLEPAYFFTSLHKINLHLGQWPLFTELEFETHVKFDAMLMIVILKTKQLFLVCSVIFAIICSP